MVYSVVLEWKTNQLCAQVVFVSQFEAKAV